MRRELTEGTHKLLAPENARTGIAAAVIGGAVVHRVQPGGALSYYDEAGRLLGTMTARNEVARRIAGGEFVIHCTVNSISFPNAKRPFGGVNVRIITSPTDEPYVEPRGGGYHANIVGESFYQEAIARCRVSDVVKICRQPDNPQDPQALAVTTEVGEIIGYLPQDGWLWRAINGYGGHGWSAEIAALHPGPNIAVVLEVQRSRFGLTTIGYNPPAPGKRRNPPGA